MRNSARMSSLRFVVLCMGLAACAKANPPALGGETNWLKRCSDREACGQGSCICGVCTKACSSDKQCSGGFAGTCIDARETLGARACEDTRAPAGGLCLPVCMSDAECGGSFACREGACVTTAVARRVDATRDSDAEPSAAGDPDAKPVEMPPPNAPPPVMMTPPAVAGPTQPVAESSCPKGVHAGNAVVRVKADIEKLRDCKQVSGDLLIISDELQDLTGLENLNTVEGGLIVAPNEESASDFMSRPIGIADSKIKSLKGLEGLKRVGTLVLLGLDVTTLEPLSSLETAPFVWVRYMAQLRDLKGLEKLDWEKFSLGNNDELQSLTGLRVQASKHVMFDVSESPKLSDLSVLQALVSVSDNIRLFGLDISDLTGLRALERVGNSMTSAGGLWISGCARLRDLTGLGKLQSTAALVLNENENLDSLAGMALTAPPNTLSITGSPRLTSLAPAIPAGGSWNAQSVSLERLPGLKTLGDLATLQSATSLMVQECHGLTDLSGLEQLKTAGQIFITSCQGLTGVKGLDNLTSVMGIVALSRNPALTNARPLGNLKSFGSVVVEGNEKLPQCEVDWLAQQLKTMLPADLNGSMGTCPP